MKNRLAWLAEIGRRARSDLRKYESRREWASRGVTIAREALIYQELGTTLEMGEGTVVAPYAILHMQNDPQRPGASSSRLVIGRRVAINEFSNLRASGGAILIGDDCLLAQFVSIIATNHGSDPTRPMRDQPWDTTRRDVCIGSDVWIGASVVIVPGVVIGNGSIVGAGAVVTRSVPDLSIVAGVPARVIGRRR